MLTFFGVVKRRLLGVFPGGISHNIDVDDLIAVLLRSKCVLEQLALLAHVTALSVGEEVLNIAVEGTVRTQR